MNVKPEVIPATAIAIAPVTDKKAPVTVETLYSMAHNNQPVLEVASSSIRSHLDRASQHFLAIGSILSAVKEYLSETEDSISFHKWCDENIALAPRTIATYIQVHHRFNNHPLVDVVSYSVLQELVSAPKDIVGQALVTAKNGNLTVKEARLLVRPPKVAPAVSLSTPDASESQREPLGDQKEPSYANGYGEVDVEPVVEPAINHEEEENSNIVNTRQPLTDEERLNLKFEPKVEPEVEPVVEPLVEWSDDQEEEPVSDGMPVDLIEADVEAELDLLDSPDIPRRVQEAKSPQCILGFSQFSRNLPAPDTVERLARSLSEEYPDLEEVFTEAYRTLM